MVRLSIETSVSEIEEEYYTGIRILTALSPIDFSTADNPVGLSSIGSAGPYYLLRSITLDAIREDIT